MLADVYNLFGITDAKSRVNLKFDYKRWDCRLSLSFQLLPFDIELLSEHEFTDNR